MTARKNMAVPVLFKRALTEKAEQLCQDKFRPALLFQAEAAKSHNFNYPVEVNTTWRGKYFYFCTKYRRPEHNGVQEFFEVRTPRIEYVGNSLLSLAYRRHTSRWCEVFFDMSLDECFETIEQMELFWPFS